MKTARFLSNYVKSKDVKSPTTVTVTSAEAETFQAGKPEEKTSLVIYFREIEQGVVLCKESIRQLEEITGSDDTDNWVGKKIVMFNDPTIKYGGKAVGGIRFRAAEKAGK